jgi:G1/S-specific cyclin PLC1
MVDPLDMMEEAIYHLAQLPITPDMIDYVGRKASQVIPKILCSHPHLSSSSSDAAIPSIVTFVMSVVEKSSVSMPTLMTSLVYLNRLRLRLPLTTSGKPTSTHRVFLTALILAAKNVNDVSPKNKHWARYSSMSSNTNVRFGFHVAEINVMERQLLHQLDWNMRVSVEDLYYQLEPLLAAIHAHHFLATRQLKADICYRCIIRTRTPPNLAIDPPSNTVRYK